MFVNNVIKIFYKLIIINMKFRNAVAVAALIGHANSIKVHDKNSNLLERQNPEE